MMVAAIIMTAQHRPVRSFFRLFFGLDLVLDGLIIGLLDLILGSIQSAVGQDPHANRHGRQAYAVAQLADAVLPADPDQQSREQNADAADDKDGKAAPRGVDGGLVIKRFNARVSPAGTDCARCQTRLG